MPEPKSTHENLDSPITGQFRSSPFYVAIGAPALAVALDIAAAWVCYRILPPDVARDQMALINPMLLVSGAGGNLLGVGGMVKRAIDLTQGKIKAQLPQPMPETVNAGGDVTVGAQPSAMLANDAQGVVPQPDLASQTEAYNKSVWPDTTPDDIQAAAVLEQEAQNNGGN